MALMQTLVSNAGPLPLVGNFTAEGDGNAILYVSGSAWSETPQSPITIAVFVDSAQIGTISCFTNEATSHKTLVPAFFPITLTQGQHVIELTTALDGGITVTDENDNFNVTLIY